MQHGRMKRRPVVLVFSSFLASLAVPAWGQEMPPAAPTLAPQPSGSMPTAAAAATPARTAHNAVYIELLGNGVLYSMNYDRMVTDDISVRVGLMYLSVSASSGDASAKASLAFIPVVGNYLLGKGDHKFELGLGALLVYASASSGTSDDFVSGSGGGVGGTAVIGYRYAPHDGGFVFRGGFTPVFGQGGFLPWFGLSLGYAF